MSPNYPFLCNSVEIFLYGSNTHLTPKKGILEVHLAACQTPCRNSYSKYHNQLINLDIFFEKCEAIYKLNFFSSYLANLCYMEL